MSVAPTAPVAPMSSSSSRSRRATGRCLPPLFLSAVAALIALVTLSTTTVAAASPAGSIFVGPSGVLVDAPLRVQSIDVVYTLQLLQAQLASQAAELASQAATIAALTTTVTEQAAEIDSLQSTVSAQGVTLVSHSVSLVSLAEYDANNTVQVSAIVSAASALTARVATTESNITSLQSDVRAIESAAVLLTARVSASESTITSIESNLTAVQLAAAALTLRVTTAETAAATLKGRVDVDEAAAAALTVRVTSTETNITSLMSELSAVESAAIALATRVSTAETSITNLTTRLTAAENLDGVSTALTTTVTGHTTQLAAVAIVDATQTKMLAFINTRPSFRAVLTTAADTQGVSSSAVTTVAFNAVSYYGANATSVFSWDSSTYKLTLKGAVSGDIDAGLTRRFDVSATLRMVEMDSIYCDFGMYGTSLIFTFQEASTALRTYSGSVGGVVSVAPNATLSTYLWISAASGTATVRGYSYTFFSVAMI